MRNHRIFFSVFLTLCLSIMFSCRKDEITPIENEGNINPGPTAHTGHIDSTLYPYLFESGSYWIYEDMNGIIDSVKLESVTEHEFLIMKYNYEHGLKLIWESTVNGSYREFVFGRLITAGWYNGGYRFYVSDTDSPIGNLEFERIEEMEISDETYYNVIKVLIKPDDFTPEEMIFYYAPHVGIIRKEDVIHRETENAWNLIDYSVSAYQF